MSDLMFIAEIGSNWFGSVDIAKYLMDKAKESGATHAKFQLFKADDLYKPDWEWYKHAKLCELDYDTARILKNYADKINIGWFASVHTKEDIDFLVDIKAPFIKIKASQGEDTELINYACKTGIDVIQSVPIEIDAHHAPRYSLYTVSKYPCKWEDINFRHLGFEFHKGFSDHTQGIQASLCASMYENIFIFERHFTAQLWAKFTIQEELTPDFRVSIFPHQFKEMVEKIKIIKGQ